MRKLLALAGALTLGYIVSACGGSWLVGAIFGAALGVVLANVFWSGKASASKRAGVKKQPGTEPVTQPAPTKTRQPQITLRLNAATPFKQNAKSNGEALVWHQAGELVPLKTGHTVNGMIYTTSRDLPWPGESSAIDERLPVAAKSAGSAEKLPYYPNYKDFTAQQRRVYLDWLASGRPANHSDQFELGYVFIFFYGIERRLILEDDSSALLFDELIKLMVDYGTTQASKSLITYGSQLVHFAGYRTEVYPQLSQRLFAIDDRRTFKSGSQFILANLYNRGEPLRAEIAIMLAAADENSRKSKVTTRVKDEFHALFGRRFEETWPGGMKLEVAKLAAVVQYRPASGALLQLTYQGHSGEKFVQRVPHLLPRQFKGLPKIWNSCIDDLSGYSRARSRVKSLGSELSAWNALPSELRNKSLNPINEAFKTLVAAAPLEDAYRIVEVGEIAHLIGLAEALKLTPAQSRQITSALRGIGWSLAPDLSILGSSLSWRQEVAVFEPCGEVGAKLAVILRLLFLSVIVASDEGNFDGARLKIFEELVEGESPNPADWQHIHGALIILRRDSKSALRSLASIAKAIPDALKRPVIATLAEMAAVTGKIGVDQARILHRIGRAFAIDGAFIEQLVAEAMFKTGAVVLKGETGQPGERIPRPVAPTGFALDASKIEALTKETHEVISILSKLMTESDQIESESLRTDTASTAAREPAEWFSDLDERYHPAFLNLITKDEMSLRDFEIFAATYHFIPEDLFNTINSWSDEALGDFLLERGDNICVRRELLSKIPMLVAAA